jgi:hypothetical protein
MRRGSAPLQAAPRRRRTPERRARCRREIGGLMMRLNRVVRLQLNEAPRERRSCRGTGRAIEQAPTLARSLLPRCCDGGHHVRRDAGPGTCSSCGTRDHTRDASRHETPIASSAMVIPETADIRARVVSTENQERRTPRPRIAPSAHRRPPSSRRGDICGITIPATFHEARCCHPGLSPTPPTTH